MGPLSSKLRENPNGIKLRSNNIRQNKLCHWSTIMFESNVYMRRVLLGLDIGEYDLMK